VSTEGDPDREQEASADPARDERASEPPAEPGDSPDEGGAGPFGNPSEDEEALANRQQERDEG
jgi:hypothetical protein